MPAVGITVGGHMSTVADLARLAEDGGYESVWVAETAYSAFVQAALACQATTTVKVGTNIALAFPRSPTITAMTARDLAELSGNRFILGLGSQVKRVNEHRFSVAFEHPAPKMAEYVEVVRPAVERGATGGGRDPSEVSITNSVILQLNEDRERARIEAALQIAFYATTRTYAPVLAMHGFDDRIAPLRDAYRTFDMATMADIAKPMVDTYAITGRADECKEQLDQFDGLVDRLLLGGAWVGPDQEAIAENYRRILHT